MEQDQQGRRRSIRIIEKTLKSEANTEKTPASISKKKGRQQSALVQTSERKKQDITGKHNSLRRTQKPQANTARRASKRTAPQKTANVAKRGRRKKAQGVASTRKQPKQEKDQHKRIRPSTKTQIKRKAQSPEPSSLSPEPQSKKQRQEQNPAVLDSNIDQELPLGSAQFEGDAAVYYWINNGIWPKEMPQSTPNTQLLNTHLASRPPTIPQVTQTLEPTTAARSNPYATNACETYLRSKGSYMRGSVGVAENDKTICQDLLRREECETPSGTAFGDDACEYVLNCLSDGNETGVTRMISQLIVPSPVLEIHRGRLRSTPILIESINQPWSWSTSLDEDTSTRRSAGAKEPMSSLPTPRPDYAVGFASHAFTCKQIRKLKPLLGGPNETSVCKGIEDMLFPFLACEVKSVKSTTGNLMIAERQNAHTLTRCLRGVVELFKLLGCENELHRRILGFSFCHDQEQVQVFAHFPVVETAEPTSYYRVRIGKWSILDKHRWRSYKFSMAIYHDWVPAFFALLCSAIDRLPDIPSDVAPRQSLIQPESPTDEESSGGKSSFLEDKELVTDTKRKRGNQLQSVIERRASRGTKRLKEG
ncbi:similar to An07g06920 [Aspergillus luchuensis]|uniref:Similar to An07g06920 n=1 Tax=Aspergillus kawachii TaxID=1069201 RepID=A0A146F1E6_ASPKA|nr:similar to An07g06920 [Aspergillus luchuensis IFO 4308]GAT20000.1 similar to An07g06920 [Aspergillus luchuensis]